MQFITNGPDIPDALLQAHEEGRVVFFCGAGISYPAGLPSFQGLVKQIYELNGTTFLGFESEAFDRGQFDLTLELLERRLPGERLAVRRALMQVLQPNTRRKGAIDSHAALLRLARNRGGTLRLVTTNFDRIFQRAAKRTNQSFQTYAAPMLPVPKNSRWNGLVHLHGLLPERLDDSALHRLVTTSGDFGLAYLTERWASRFVSELFRNYEVCFVGYSINDPVLRYMMDALAADQRQGEVRQRAWAFGDCELGQEERKKAEWDSKGVTPILYQVPNNDSHNALHQTLQAWADTYRDGVQGKEAIVIKHALARPEKSTKQDDVVGRMLWAMSDKSGLPAKRFADFNPVPSLDWLLECFSQERFDYSDLTRFDVPPRDELDTKLRFSLILRPSPYHRAPPMLLAAGGVINSHWDDLMYNLARWLTRHLNDPRLIIWIAERGGQLHDSWRRMIELELDRLASLEREGDISELSQIRQNSPNAIPGPLMRTLWGLLLSGRIKSQWHDPDIYRWKDRVKREGLTTALRLELRELLAPKVVLKKPILWDNDDTKNNSEPSKINQLVDWELVLTADHVSQTLKELNDEQWKLILPHLLEDFQHLLRDALDLLRELGHADDYSDRSHWDLPSITPHAQNNGFHDWVSLIELLRDAWLAVRENDVNRAKRIAQNWIELPYSTFKRLALFAASQDNSIRPEQWVDWLITDNARLLWSTDTKREVLRLFVLQGRHLKGNALKCLETAILSDPPRSNYWKEVDAEEWQNYVSRSVWLRLTKLNSSGCVLGKLATARLTKISNTYPNWQLATNERDEFSLWMGGNDDSDYDDSREVDIAPRNRKDLVAWLNNSIPSGRHLYEDTWQDVCRTRFFHSLLALNDLAQNSVWPEARWREALQIWSEDGMVSRSWRYAAPLVQIMPDAVIKVIARDVTWWLEAISKVIDVHENLLLDLCVRVLELPLETNSNLRITSGGVEIEDIVGSAINHPIGLVTRALINLWLKENPSDNDLLPDILKTIFTKLCDVHVDRFRHGRVLLGTRLIAFFRVDRSWTERNLLPLFDWCNPVEARATWKGFLWSPRLYQPLLIAFKPQFLETAKNYANLGDHAQQFSAFLTYAALGPTDGFSVDDFRSAIGALPKKGLEESAQALYQALEGSGDQREDYWKNRVQPFWQQIWPKSRHLATGRLAESLTRLVIASRGEFPAALAAVQDWLQPIEHLHHVIHLLADSELCRRFPTEALQLLSKVIADQAWAPRELEKCLNMLEKNSSTIAQDDEYLRLREYIRMRGMF